MLGNIDFYGEEEQDETKPISQNPTLKETSSNNTPKKSIEESKNKMSIEDDGKYKHASLKHKIINYKILL